MPTAAALTATSAGGAMSFFSVFGKERQKFWIGTMQMSSAYQTNGETLDPGGKYFRVIKEVIASPQGGYTFEYMPLTKKLKAWASPGVEVALNVDLKALTAIPIMIIGL
jgi:hypothetical protein